MLAGLPGVLRKSVSERHFTAGSSGSEARLAKARTVSQGQ